MEARVQLFAITIPYLGFSITDGALRMLIVLHFNAQGFTPFEIAALFLLYEIAGIITNFIGGYIGAVLGLTITFLAGFVFQLVSLFMLLAPDAWLSVPYIMLSQGLAGIAKDLVKVSSKSSLKVITPEGKDASLFKSVSMLTGSKNAFKGIGFLVGGLMDATIGLRGAALLMAVCLGVGGIFTAPALPRQMGKVKKKVKFSSMFSKTPAINVLSAARYFLFASRDIWFVVGLPVFLGEVFGWSSAGVGAFMGCWILVYGFSQTSVPRVFDGSELARTMGSKSVAIWSGALSVFPALIAISLSIGAPAQLAIIVGLYAYGFFFSVNSIIHSYLVLAYSDRDKASADVGFYYMANSGGRLMGSLLSGWVYQTQGIVGCLWWSVGCLVAAGIISLWLPKLPAAEASESNAEGAEPSLAGA